MCFHSQLCMPILAIQSIYKIGNAVIDYWPTTINYTWTYIDLQVEVCTSLNKVAYQHFTENFINRSLIKQAGGAMVQQLESFLMEEENMVWFFSSVFLSSGIRNIRHKVVGKNKRNCWYKILRCSETHIEMKNLPSLCCLELCRIR